MGFYSTYRQSNGLSMECQFKGRILVATDHEAATPDPQPRPDREREWLPVKEFKRTKAPHLGINSIYRGCETGELASIRIGGRILIASDALDLRMGAK